MDRPAAQPNAVGIFHINLNCTNLDSSTAFYELIGFRTIIDFNAVGGGRSFADVGLSPILRVPEDCEALARFLILGDDMRATRLDLIQWTRPPTTGRLPVDLTAVGVPRMCLRVRDAEAMYARLAEAGHTVFAPPRVIDMGGTRQKVFCCADPDGFAVEFMEFLREHDGTIHP
jgi:catechol 2,3-dioxygenase-like lactoylglutathione lyase family enzyme